MNDGVVAKAIAFANSDGEFRYNARWWTGSMTILVDGSGWRMEVTRGKIGVASSATGDGLSGSGDHFQVNANAETWSQLLASVPPSGYVDYIAAAAVGGLVLSPAHPDAERHLATRRFCELLRAAVNGSDPAPKPGGYTRPHGTFDKATGRYVHLNIGGYDNRVYFEEAGSGIGLLCQHTAGADGRQFRHFLEDERITSKYRVIVYDMPFHGKSLPPVEKAWWAERYTLTPENAMALPVQLAQVLGLDRPVFIGS
ncbi:MAG: alpha/beta fold hydrolase, partial [Actinomycetota bacterium]